MTILRTNLVTTTGDKTILRSTGNVLQSKFINSITTSQPTTTSTSYIPTGISINFTPLQATSKLYIRFIFNLVYTNTVSDGGCMVKLYRDGAVINSASNSDNFVYRSTPPGGNAYAPGKIIHYVNANTTNPTTFEIYQRSYDGEAAAITGYWGTNSMMIMEIAA
jgi:hypothetical protein